MPILLDLTFILVLLAIGIGLVPLLFQLRRSAQSLDRFLLSTSKDLSQIADDVHASRVRMDHLAISLQASLDDLSTFTQMMGSVGTTLTDFQHRFQSTIDSASRTCGGLLGGVSAVLAFFNKPSTKP